MFEMHNCGHHSVILVIYCACMICETSEKFRKLVLLMCQWWSSSHSMGKRILHLIRSVVFERACYVPLLWNPFHVDRCLSVMIRPNHNGMLLQPLESLMQERSCPTICSRTIRSCFDLFYRKLNEEHEKGILYAGSVSKVEIRTELRRSDSAQEMVTSCATRLVRRVGRVGFGLSYKWFNPNWPFNPFMIHLSQGKYLDPYRT